MLSNRSMLKSVVIPQLAYRDVGEAVSWLCSAFGFKERVRIGNHRAQLTFPGGGVARSNRRSSSAQRKYGRLRVPSRDGSRFRCRQSSSTLRPAWREHSQSAQGLSLW